MAGLAPTVDEHVVGPGATGEGPDLLGDVGGGGRHRRGGAELAGGVELVVGHVEGDDLSRHRQWRRPARR